jgi:hypothetical protein
MEQSPNVHKIRAICSVTRNLDGPKGSRYMAARDRKNQLQKRARANTNSLVVVNTSDDACMKQNVRQISALSNVMAN